MTHLDTKKEQERSILHSSLRRISDELRGEISLWDFRHYVLAVLFYRFISENITNYINKRYDSIDYVNISDEDAEIFRINTIKEKGFYILPSELFVNVIKKIDLYDDFGEHLLHVFNKIEGSSGDFGVHNGLQGLFSNFDIHSNKLGVTEDARNDKLKMLMKSISRVKIGDYRDNTIDAFGDAYEYLMNMYAIDSGKSGGEYYTPQEVSELLAEITTIGKNEVNKVYDPCCGSGSLLLKFAKVLGKDNVRGGFYGQEINITTYNLCRINMFLHDINYDNFDIAHGNTLTDPKHWDYEPFDAIVSNPPYSIKWDGDANPLMINDPRFSPAGVLAPKSKADLAFVMHILSWLSTSGTAAIVEFPGVLYRSGAEQKIRKYLIDNNYIDTIIQLPPDLFFGTGIATCIIILKKSKKDNKTLFIDASTEFVRGGNKNKLSEANRKRILNTFVERTDIPYFARLVDNNDIAENDYNIAVSSYITAEDTRKTVDIIELNEEIERIVARQEKLRREIDAIVAELESNNSNTI